MRIIFIFCSIVFAVNKAYKLTFLLFIIANFSLAQSFRSVRDWPMPQGDERGLVTPGFNIVPKFVVVRLGNEIHVHLQMSITMGTAQNPVAPFSYRYLYHGKVYTDNDLGPQPFYPIKLARAVFSVRVMRADNYSRQIEFVDVMEKFDLGIFPKDINADGFTARVEALTEVSYRGTEAIEQAIRNIEAKVKASAQNAAPAVGMKQADPRLTTAQQPTTKPAANTQSAQTPTNPTSASKTDNSFWSDNGPAKKSEPGNVIPEQAIHKNLPDFVRTTDGGYFHKGADGKFRQVTEQEYQEAKKAASASRNVPQQPEQQQMTSEEVRNAVNKMFTDAEARNTAITQNIERTVDAWRQSFYYSEAIRNGKESLAALSKLNGDYGSVQELEDDFNQKYNSIRAEVNNLEQARNARLANATAANFNGSSTEQAIGQGMNLIGGFVNSLKADKEAKEARAALEAERARQIAEIKLKKQQARTEMRNKLVKSFPDGGTPITSHKITLPEVYMFAYITDKASFNNDQATVSVSSVFPVAQYSDGTFPYKTTVAGKLRGYAPGEVVLVGYYGDKTRAEEMRNSFLNLAAKSELGVKTFALKSVSTGSSGKSAVPGDFWETGKKTPASTPATEKKSDFWNN